jgi:catechol 2,3-dioxygenase
MSREDGVRTVLERPYGVEPSGYRLPGDTRVGVVRLQVADLERSLDWYVRVLGLTPLREGAGRAALGPEGGATLIELVERPGAKSIGRHARLGLFHFALLVPDRAALGRLVAHLSAIREPIGASDHAVSEALYLRDPDGLGVEVYVDRPRAEWRVEGREIVMVTEPLDLPGLMGAAEGVAWSGMPAGTVVGHVHLHVGDLAQAQAFYHDRLGLDKTVWSYPGALFLAAGGYHHHLGVNVWAADAEPAAEDEARLLAWELVVPTEADVHGAIGSLTETPADDGRVADPWGTVLRVCSAEADYHALGQT